MRLFRRSRKRQMKAMTDIPLTPLIDTALTLLIIFMVTTPMLQNAIKVNLPKGKAQEGKGSDAQSAIVYVDAQSHCFFNGKKYQQNQLIDAIKKYGEHKKEKVVIVKADRGVSYGKVMELIDHIKVAGGIDYVVLATQKQNISNTKQIA
jgi:biopolymer transport protein TolR